jgi:hypothetical protein
MGLLGNPLIRPAGVTALRIHCRAGFACVMAGLTSHPTKYKPGHTCQTVLCRIQTLYTGGMTRLANSSVVPKPIRADRTDCNVNCGIYRQGLATESAVDPAWGDLEETTLIGTPGLLADTEAGIQVLIGVLHSKLTVCTSWSVTAVAIRITLSGVVLTGRTAPVLATRADLGRRCVHIRVWYTGYAIVVCRTCAAKAARITLSYPKRAVLPLPACLTDTVAVAVMIGASNAVCTVDWLRTDTGAAGGIAEFLPELVATRSRPACIALTE